MRIILAMLLLSPAVFGQWDAAEDSCDVTDLIDSLEVWEEIEEILDTLFTEISPKPKCPDFVEIFYTDTVGWYLDTTTVQVSCPGYNYGNLVACAVMHWDDKIQWKPIVETISIFKFEPSTFEHFKRWRMRKQ